MPVNNALTARRRVKPLHASAQARNYAQAYIFARHMSANHIDV